MEALRRVELMLPLSMLAINAGAVVVWSPVLQNERGSIASFVLAIVISVDIGADVPDSTAVVVVVVVNYVI